MTEKEANGGYAIRQLAAHEWPAYRDIRLRSLAESPEAFGSTLAAEEVRAPEAWAARLAAAVVSGQDCPLIAESGGAPVGLLWAKVDAGDPAIVNLFQMWVAPECRGHGVAAALLRESVAWARSRRALVVQLDVTCGDTSAARLYVREGFQPHGAPQPRPGTALFEQTMRLATGR
ncbi:GNAT family N-acetyltransferase [Pseudoduganella namucuonensis]|uniref:Acetyltransferase (GNAT) family protein n=1 Tax=Pseudoduganella namucuonensis TaxID=1035707 RepID=A0A1I7LTB1_9BURK|nr:GNAT family N-acetyltransferase [Pseudoduganella namucuonensis]SFV12903.1 Acetyltransferase (GNAT) family protein [Pseudoduganella namucuonensis]